MTIYKKQGNEIWITNKDEVFNEFDETLKITDQEEINKLSQLIVGELYDRISELLESNLEEQYLKNNT
jgi:hypothetical protein